MSELLTENFIIREIFETKKIQIENGNYIDVNSNIRLELAEALYQTVLKVEPKSVIEIGMAFAVSSLAILTAFDKLGGDRQLISIDPNQSTQWKNGGVSSVKRAGFGRFHLLIEDFEYFALPGLLKQNTRVDFAYIDGWHTFDYALLDFWFIDKMLETGGVVAFNDCHLAAVGKVIDFLISHRKYEEIDAGLTVEYSDYTPFKEVKRLVTAQPRKSFYKQAQDRYFRKVKDYEPDWDFYAEF